MIVTAAEKAENIFRCPLCGEKMYRFQQSWLCEQKHCFDIAKTGYINFIPNQKKLKYTKELFEHRQLVLQSGCYEPLVQALDQVLRKYQVQSFLDVGCGEGYYTKRLAANKTLQAYAMDITKDAIILAAKGQQMEQINWLVGDLANIPMQAQSVDAVLNIFTPANYGEFQRILKKQGLVIKVIPGSGYLQQLRVVAEKKIYNNDDVVHIFQENLLCLEQMVLNYQLAVTPQQVYHLAKMTPMMFNVDVDNLDLTTIKEITIDVQILVGTFQK